MSEHTDELAGEQAYVDRLYARLDELRGRTARELAAVRGAGPSGTHQNRSERDAFATLHEQRLAQLEAVEDRLAFGRLDLAAGGRRYIGRLGLSDDEQTQLLVDWRAPASRSFYQATAAEPGDVVRRRHLSTRARSVLGVEDEVLDLEALDQSDRATLVGEGALLAAVGAHRTGRMADIVATIQAEQDRVIRSDLGGVLVVHGGPGTGKTAVALHRAAYLLYTHRERLARSGVLLVGPNSLFLRYIEQVLPSLGETGVVMSTPASLFPGVEPTADERPEVAAVKGDRRMADVIAAAVRERQRVPGATRRLAVDGQVLELRPEVVASARGRARCTRKPHNRARRGFLLELLEHLAVQLATTLGTTLSPDTREDLLDDLRESPDVRRELNLAWMPLTPTQLVSDLLADAAALDRAGAHLTPAERGLLLRERASAWTVADVPLLDEAAELLGPVASVDHAAEAAARVRRAEDLANARAALRNIDTAIRPTVEQLADRFAETGPALTVAERAASDRSWAYGHLVVDEAQELSPMTWRLLMRRCPSRSMTLVGDVAQTGSPAGAGSWAEALDPFVAGRWRVEQLTTNYRTPAPIMELGTAVLRAAGIETDTPESVRDGDRPPTARRVEPGDVDAVVATVREEVSLLGAGRLAVIVPGDVQEKVRLGLAESLGDEVVGSGSATLDRPVSVLTVADAKGLEFDSVVLLEPAQILRASPRGANDLYVAITRPTQSLHVLHSDDLPPGLTHLAADDVGPGRVAALVAHPESE